MGYQKFIENFQKSVASINKSSDDSQFKNIAFIKLCQNSLSTLKEEMNELGFEDNEEEIVFFKRHYPTKCVNSN